MLELSSDTPHKYQQPFKIESVIELTSDHDIGESSNEPARDIKSMTTTTIQVVTYHLAGNGTLNRGLNQHWHQIIAAYIAP
jgi:hypothetical protein